jgi:hypothetical protein
LRNRDKYWESSSRDGITPAKKHSLGIAALEIFSLDVKVKIFPDTSRDSSWQSVFSWGRMFLPRKHHSKEEHMTAEAKIGHGKMTLLQRAERFKEGLGDMPETGCLPKPVLRV